jgi:hypothetical protein
MASYKKDINLLSAMTQKKSRVNPFVIIVPILIFLMLGALIVFATFWYTTTMASLTIERNDLQSYIDSTRVTDSQNNAEEVRIAATEMGRRADEVVGMLYILSSYPDLGGEQFQAIFEFAGDNVQLADYVYDRRTGTLSFSATSTSVRNMPRFVQSMRECGHFSDIQYRGFVRSTHLETGEPVTNPVTEVTTIVNTEIVEYRYEIVCKLVTPIPFLPPVETDGEGTGDTTGGGTGQ